MEVRGERECTECGTRWSYFETGTVECPACGSLRSVGSGPRRVHTDSPISLDLTDVLTEIDTRSLETVTTEAAAVCRDYVRKRGFISGGDLRNLDDTYVAALECRHVDGLLAGYGSLTDDEQLYVLSLLDDAGRGTRPPPGEVPQTLQAARGLAVSRAMTDYRRAIGEWTADRSLDGTVGTAIEALGDHATRLDQLGGDVDPETAEALLSITRSLGEAVRTDDESTAADVLERLDEISYRA